MAGGWFTPSNCGYGYLSSNYGYKCGCNCSCPRCRLYYGGGIDPVTGEPVSKCRLYWDCCASEEGYVALIDSTGTDYGVVSNKSSIGTDNVAKTYSLITTKPYCTSRTLTFSVPANDCPCPFGCHPPIRSNTVVAEGGGAVSRARSTATLAVYDWGPADVTFFPGTNCEQRVQADFSVLNHVRSFSVRHLTYTKTISGTPTRCSFDYIAADDVPDIYLGDVTYTRTWTDNLGLTLTATATYEAWTRKTTLLAQDGVTLGLYGYYIQLEFVSEVTATGFVCGANRTLSAKITTFPPSPYTVVLPEFGNPGGPDTVIPFGPSVGLFTNIAIMQAWCAAAVNVPSTHPDYQNEWTHEGYFLFDWFNPPIGSFTPRPANSKGRFKWESLA